MSRHGRHAAIWIGVVVLAIAIYLAIGVRAANTWAHPHRNTYFSSTPASFDLKYRDVRLPSRDAGIEISGWWIPRAGSGKAIVMVHGRGENRTTEFYDHFLDLGAALNTFQGRGFNILMIDLRAHGLSGGVDSEWGIGERHDVEGAVDWIKSQGFQAAASEPWAPHSVRQRASTLRPTTRTSAHSSPMAPAWMNMQASRGVGRGRQARPSSSFPRHV